MEYKLFEDPLLIKLLILDAILFMVGYFVFKSEERRRAGLATSPDSRARVNSRRELPQLSQMPVGEVIELRMGLEAERRELFTRISRGEGLPEDWKERWDRLNKDIDCVEEHLKRRHEVARAQLRREAATVLDTAKSAPPRRRRRVTRYVPKPKEPGS